MRDVDEKLGERISALLCPSLINAVKSDSPEVVQECLDVLNDLLGRFGACTSATHLKEIQTVTLPHLDSKRNLIKQRSIWVLTNVARVSPEAAFQTLSDALVQKMGGAIKNQASTIQLVGSIARNVGFRMGKNVNSFVPLLATAISKSSAEGDEDIKENAFQTFGSFVESCPRDIIPHIDTVLGLCLKFLAWDPNQLEDSEGLSVTLRFAYLIFPRSKVKDLLVLEVTMMEMMMMTREWRQAKTRMTRPGWCVVLRPKPSRPFATITLTVC